ncbi:hypothetical protein CGZ93_07530 [Enemella dayhoffiae]|uniref:Uncharacterized protein n=1 Tax=Enemella dayhoffiae TaxID=2016507 RepID=A0A255H4Y3_9ACTN|nr:hypothetical protein CGZ93_07530 [Enemella dayhoffiae]
MICRFCGVGCSVDFWAFSVVGDAGVGTLGAAEALAVGDLVTGAFVAGAFVTGTFLAGAFLAGGWLGPVPGVSVLGGSDSVINELLLAGWS